MKVLFLLLFLSLAGNDRSENGIPYRRLSWSDFRGTAKDKDAAIAARITTQLVLSTTSVDGVYYFVVKCYFLPDSSFVRVRSDQNLRHEQTHFKIAYIASLKCAREIAPLQGTTRFREAESIYNTWLRSKDDLNENFDAVTAHGLNIEAENTLEMKISAELHLLETSAALSNGRKRKN